MTEPQGRPLIEVLFEPDEMSTGTNRDRAARGETWSHLTDLEVANLLFRMTSTTAPRTPAAYRRDLAREVARRLRARAKDSDR